MSVRFRVPEQLLLPWSPQQTISVRRAAEILHCGESTVIRMIERGELKAYQLWPGHSGSPYRIYYDSLLLYLDKLHDEAGVECRFEI
jgi:excisionase family DNA binding protein